LLAIISSSASLSEFKATSGLCSTKFAASSTATNAAFNAFEFSVCLVDL